MSQDYQHEPSEGNARVHVAEQGLALPYLGVQEDIADDVLEIYDPEPGIDQGEEELLSVRGRQLYDDPDNPYYKIGDDENHTYHEREHEIVVS